MVQFFFCQISQVLDKNIPFDALTGAGRFAVIVLQSKENIKGMVGMSLSPQMQIR